MTQKEYQQACEIERLKKDLNKKNNKIKDLESEKKNIEKQIEDCERIYRRLKEGK